MADGDIHGLNASETSGNNLYDQMGFGPPSWESMGLSQVLLPVLCALFIAAVIIIIACCLIQGKSASSRVDRQKSCHTIETLHEASDLDIYDVIEEVRVRSFSPDKVQRRQDKLDNPGVLAWQHLPTSKLAQVFSSKSTPTGCPSKFDLLTSKMSVRSSREWIRNIRESVANDAARLSSQSEGRASYTSNEEDRIYETLDRHWTLRNGQKVTGQQQSLDKDKTIDSEHRCLNCGSEVSRKQNTEANTTAFSATSISNCPVVKFESLSSSACPDISQKDSRALVCQVRTFDLSPQELKPALIETSYYKIQPQFPSTHMTKFVTTNSGLFGTSSLIRIIQDGSQDKPSHVDLVLRPLMSNDAALRNIASACASSSSSSPTATTTTTTTQLENTQKKVLKIYEKLEKVNPKRSPTLLLKKSKSFRNTTPESSSALQHQRISRRKSDSSDVDLQPFGGKSSTRQANICTGPEATRILTKLGPLPPLPVLDQKPRGRKGEVNSKGEAGEKDQNMNSPNLSENFHISQRDCYSATKEESSSSHRKDCNAHFLSRNASLSPSITNSFSIARNILEEPGSVKKLNSLASAGTIKTEPRFSSGSSVVVEYSQEVDDKGRHYGQQASDLEGACTNFYFVLESGDTQYQSLSPEVDLSSTDDLTDSGD